MSTFDERAADWDSDPGKVRNAREVAAAIAAVVPLGPTTRLFEYGAGTGLLSQALLGRGPLGRVVLADVSVGMREVMAAKVAAGLLGGAEIGAFDLSSQPPPDETFDVVVTMLVLHHILEVEPVLRGFAALLEPGGWLCIADLDREDGSFHAGTGMDVHDGFDRGDLGGRLENAGFTDIAFTTATHVDKDPGTYPVFLATCRRR